MSRLTREGSRWPWTLALVSMLVVASAAPASASEAEVIYTQGNDDPRFGSSDTERLSVRDDVGEDNFLTTVVEATGRPFVLSITDSKAPLEAGTGCVQVDPNTARCRFGLGPPSADFHGGAGDDVIDLRSLGASAYIDGGAGADTLTTPDRGGPANGGPGPDTLIGGSGTNYFTDSGPTETDEYHGGGGEDTIVYEREDSLSIDLLTGIGGAPGEHDKLVGFTRAYGGTGADLLRGSNGPDSLQGGYGTDRIEGRGGDDDLEGAGGSYRGFPFLPGAYDVILGGDGDDRLKASPGGLGHARLEGGQGDDRLEGGEDPDVALGGGGADVILTGGGRDVIEGGPGDDIVAAYGLGARLVCGPDDDVVAFARPLIEPADDCERIDINDGLQASRLIHIRRRRAVLRLHCSRPGSNVACRGYVLIRRGSLRRPWIVGYKRYRVPLGRSLIIRVPLRPAALRRYRVRGSLQVRPRVVWQRRDGPARVDNEAEWTVRTGR